MLSNAKLPGMCCGWDVWLPVSASPDHTMLICMKRLHAICPGADSDSSRFFYVNRITFSGIIVKVGTEHIDDIIADPGKGFASEK